MLLKTCCKNEINVGIAIKWGKFCKDVQEMKKMLVKDKMNEKNSPIEAKLAQNIDIFQGWVKFIVVNTSFLNDLFC